MAIPKYLLQKYLQLHWTQKLKALIFLLTIFEFSSFLMALTTRLCPNIPTIVSLPTTLNSSSSKFGLNLVSNEALLVAAAAEAVALARAAAKAAREAAAEVASIDGAWTAWWESGDGVSKGLSLRRKKRRKRRKRLLDILDVEMDKDFDANMRLSIGSKKYGYLSPREEANCCLSLKEGVKVEATRVRISDNEEYEPTSKELAKAMGTNIRSIDKMLCSKRESQERISRSYRRLVASVAASYQSRGLTFQDLIQEGSIGLLRGAKNFDPQRGYKLSTYAYWWIRQAIIRAIENKSRIVRLPGNMCAVVARVTDANSVLSRRLRRFPTHEEIAHLANLDVSTVRLVFERSRPPISLDRAVTSRGGSMTLQEIIPGKDETTPEKMVNKQLMKREVEMLLVTVLSEREAWVLRLHFGLNGEVPLSCEEIGRQLKLSRERVRQIKNIALSKLRQTSIVNSLRMYIHQ